ncbi:phosphodiester glycosidase family protein [Caldanaerobius polysaccharolyticus]|uniref:phosphodiester glycosidase family protein n=1 Tax=Caldanaerobius polysaccharolyticus TaxID=44256 RepID=UPI000478BC22|nr:phosphodiester glycosidase family protein [Caldanaerobius polysaccharolyticus]
MGSRITLKNAILFIIFEMLFTSVTLPYLIFYGPFTHVRDTVVTTAMTTFKHQYIATLFLPKDVIDKILASNSSGIKSGSTDKNLINFKNNHDNAIDLYNISGKHFKGKLLLIHDPTRIKVGYSAYIPKKGETTSSIAKRNGAIAAINAGGFVDDGMKGTGGTPQGIIIHNGKIVYSTYTNSNDNVSLIGFTSDGKLLVGHYKYSVIPLLSIKEAVSFGPALIIDGKPMIQKGDGGWGIAPRTAIGQRKDGTVIFLVIDGRSIKSVGATLKDVQDIMLKFGAYNAVNLDGGSSTTMYFKGKVINNPSDALGERMVPTIFYAK